MLHHLSASYFSAELLLESLLAFPPRLGNHFAHDKSSERKAEGLPQFFPLFDKDIGDESMNQANGEWKLTVIPFRTLSIRIYASCCRCRSRCLAVSPSFSSRSFPPDFPLIFLWFPPDFPMISHALLCLRFPLGGGLLSLGVCVASAQTYAGSSFAFSLLMPSAGQEVDEGIWVS